MLGVLERCVREEGKRDLYSEWQVCKGSSTARSEISAFHDATLYSGEVIWQR